MNSPIFALLFLLASLNNIRGNDDDLQDMVNLKGWLDSNVETTRQFVQDELASWKIELKALAFNVDDVKSQMLAMLSESNAKIAELQMEVKAKDRRIARLEELSKIYAPKSCNDLFDHGVNHTDFYFVDLDGHKVGQDPQLAFCNVTNYLPYTIMKGKLLVATGYQSGATKTEVFDLSNPNKSCNTFPKHPQEIYGATAQVLGNKVVICGGNIGGVGSSNNCRILGQSGPFVTLKEKRQHLGSIRLNATHMMLAGGSGSSNSASSTEIISISGSSVYGPNMPAPLNRHCFIRINDEKAMLIGGERKGSSLSSKVWSLDLATLEWTELPSLNTGRFDHGCGSFTVDNKVFAIATGGYSSSRLSTTEILDVQSGQSWVDGPSLPFGMEGFQMVANPQGNGVIIMGGYSDKGLSGDFYELVCYGISCNNWKKLPLTLSVPRYYSIALNVPNEFC